MADTQVSIRIDLESKGERRNERPTRTGQAGWATSGPSSICDGFPGAPRKVAHP
jgi:hypothetical protein